MTIKNPQIRGSFILKPLFYKSRRDKNLSKLLPLVCYYSRTVLNALPCSLITFI